MMASNQLGSEVAKVDELTKSREEVDKVDELN